MALYDYRAKTGCARRVGACDTWRRRWVLGLVAPVMVAVACPIPTAEAANVLRFVGRIVESTDALSAKPIQNAKSIATKSIDIDEVSRWVDEVNIRRPELGIQIEAIDSQRSIINIEYP